MKPIKLIALAIGAIALLPATSLAQNVSDNSVDATLNSSAVASVNVSTQDVIAVPQALPSANILADIYIADAHQLQSPPVAANPQDKWVLRTSGNNKILVITKDGKVYAHDIVGKTIGIPYQLQGPPVAALDQDKWVLSDDSRILVITKDGKVFAHDIVGNTIGIPYQLQGPPVAALDQDKWVLSTHSDKYGSRILVITQDGKVFAHDIVKNNIGTPYQLQGPPVAANPQDKWVRSYDSGILVITRDGDVYAHSITGKTEISNPYKYPSGSVAALDQDKWVLNPSDLSSLWVITQDGKVFEHEFRSRIN